MIITNEGWKMLRLVFIVLGLISFVGLMLTFFVFELEITVFRNNVLMGLAGMLVSVAVVIKADSKIVSEVEIDNEEGEKR